MKKDYKEKVAEIKMRMTSELKAKEKEINTLRKALNKKERRSVQRQAQGKATVPKFGKVLRQGDKQPQGCKQVPKKQCSKVGQVGKEVEGYGGSQGGSYLLPQLLPSSHL